MATTQPSEDPAFNQQVAIVTGGCSGLGLSITKALADRGAFIEIFDLKSKEDLDFSDNSHIAFHSVDITDEVKVQEAIHEVWQKHHRIDILINCAGITGLTNIKSHETNSNNIRKVFDINFMGSYLIPTTA